MCLSSSALSSGLHMFYVMVFMLRKKMQRHWLLVDSLLMIAGEFIPEYVKHAESNSPGLISYWCNCCMSSYEDVQASKVPSCPLFGLVGFSDGRPCGTLPSLHSQWPLGSRSHLLLKLFSKLFRFFSSPESPGSLGWIPENLELSRDFLCLWDLQQAVVSPHSTEFNTDGLRSPQSISREDGRCSELHFRCQKGLKTSICWIFYSLFPLKKTFKMQISFINKDNKRLF